jgi:hypothetical protein
MSDHHHASAHDIEATGTVQLAASIGPQLINALTCICEGFDIAVETYSPVNSKSLMEEESEDIKK